MKVVLFEPQIPQNTGNIARTCAVASADLVLVRPLGFSTNSRHMKRAGLDYWNEVNVEEIDDLTSYVENRNCYFFSSKAKKHYTEVNYPEDSFLIFGSETKGLPDLFSQKWPDRFLIIPMAPNIRCINLACSVAIVLYEALRQHHFLNNENTSERTKLMRSDVVIGR